MADQIPEVDRRQKETGVIGQVMETLVGKQSRKVAFGVWGFIADNAFLAAGKITEKTWWWVFLTCAILVGCGTVLDDFLEKVGDKIAGMVASKINTAAGEAGAS